MNAWSFILTAAALTLSLTPAPATAQITQVRQLSVERIPAEIAGRYAIPIQIYPGRNSVIDFRTGEVISFIQLSDSSRLIFQTNAPIESGAARTVVIRPIQPLFFEGATTSPIPNLVVTTFNSSGDERTYLFNLVPNRQIPGFSDPNGIAIITDAQWQAEIDAQRQAAAPTNVIQTELGLATLQDIARGLRAAIDQGYTRANDPVVYDVLEVLAQTRNGVPLVNAAATVGVNLSILVALGEIGIEAAQQEAAPPEPTGEPAPFSAVGG